MVPKLLKKIEELKEYISILEAELAREKEKTLGVYEAYRELYDQFERGNYVVVADADMSAAGRSQVRWGGKAQCQEPHPI